jgi:hypothetical protein
MGRSSTRRTAFDAIDTSLQKNRDERENGGRRQRVTSFGFAS